MNDSEDDGQRKLAVEQFCHVTGANPDTAKNTLEACNWNIEMAINMHVDSVECLDPVQTAPDLNAPVSHPTASGSGANNRNSDPEEGELRAPIPPVRQVLVEDGFNHVFRGRSNHYPIYDTFRNFREEAKILENYHKQNNEDDEEEDDDEVSRGRLHKKKTLEDLFRPPIDIQFHGTLELAKETGSKENKWLLVNVQNVREFACQVLNRDVWSNSAVKSLIKSHFIFWQVYHDSQDGIRYRQFYNFHSFPYVAILDPITGELKQSWNKIDSLTFCESITEFLLYNHSPNGTVEVKPNVTPGPSSTSTSSSSLSAYNLDTSTTAANRNNVYDATEEMQLKAAIEASLKENYPSNYVEDGDDVETFDSDNEDNQLIKKEKRKLDEKELPAASLSTPIEEKYENYLGNSEATTVLNIRYPNGEKEQVSFPSDSKLKALLLFITLKGYSMNDYDVVTNFPKRNLNELSSDNTLADVGLSRENIFVQHKS